MVSRGKLKERVAAAIEANAESVLPAAIVERAFSDMKRNRRFPPAKPPPPTLPRQPRRNASATIITGLLPLAMALFSDSPPGPFCQRRAHRRD